jgi:hypothetical protein
MDFSIKINHDRKIIRLQVEKIFEKDGFEQYKVSARNKTLILQSNRPLLRDKGLRFKRPKWTLESGQLHNAALLDKIISAVYSHIEKRS